MKVNRYPGTCALCGAPVPANGGVLERSGRRWVVYHLACHKAGGARVTFTYFPSTGQTITRNVNGRCEDAPCCGCCD